MRIDALKRRLCVCQVCCRLGWMRLECVEEEVDCVGKQILQTSKM
jgi:hypothetical protein